MESNNLNELCVLSVEEMKHIDGGKIVLPSWLRGASIVVIANEIINNWDDLKQGLAEGWQTATGTKK
jgi:hypothetical protein